ARHISPAQRRWYWEQRDDGMDPARPKLPAAKDRAPIRLRVATTDEHVAVVKDALALAIEEAKRPENRVCVSDRLRAPPQLVRDAKDLLKDATPDDLGILERPSGCLDLRVSRGQLSRALRIADALVRAF